MNPLPRLRALGPKAKLGLGALALLVLLLALFDWNWLRPPLERYLSHTSGRSVRAADLHLSLDAALRPVVRLRGVRIDNAPWADTKAPFAVAGEARFTFSWPSLLQDVRVVTHLVLVDADIDLQRQADGLRNWRLTRPDDRGPPRMQVLSLEPHNSRLRVVHQGIGLVLQTAATPLAAPEGPLTQRIRFSGRWHEAPIEGEALTGPVLSLQRTGRFFPLRGQVQSGPAVLQLDGEVADLIKLGGVNAQLRLSRGRSDIAGDVRYRHAAGERRSLQATLQQRAIRAGRPACQGRQVPRRAPAAASTAAARLAGRDRRHARLAGEDLAGQRIDGAARPARPRRARPGRAAAHAERGRAGGGPAQRAALARQPRQRAERAHRAAGPGTAARQAAAPAHARRGAAERLAHAQRPGPIGGGLARQRRRAAAPVDGQRSPEPAPRCRARPERRQAAAQLLRR